MCQHLLNKETNNKDIEKLDKKEYHNLQKKATKYLKKLKKEGYFIYSADMDGEDFRGIDYAEKLVLVIGNEGNGVSRLVKEESDVLIKIPMNSNVESLNASVAASILIYNIGYHD